MAEQFFLWGNSSEKQTNKVLDNFYNDLAYRRQKKQDITIKISRTKKNVTTKQHKYIWGVFIPHTLKAMQELGNELTKEECYLFMKERLGFTKTVTIKIKDKEVERIVYETLSRKGDKDRANEFIDKGIRWVAEWLNTAVPLPIERGI